ncbi:methyltransferase, FxLD system [Streptomyces sp. NPDC051677]|uniref:methyltransferase, FxLD system n=1 Tax=Streptomyces sp. NPDC051677 TaxID=3365669 RepID=UPI0037D4335E
MTHHDPEFLQRGHRTLPASTNWPVPDPSHHQSPEGDVPLAYTEQKEWDEHYAGGQGFRQLGDSERALLAEHVPAPAEDGRALDVGCGVGDLAVHLASMGYMVDAVDWSQSALARAHGDHESGVRWLCLDIEQGDLEPLHEDGYDLITLRLMYAFLSDRTRVMHELGRRLREGGAIVVITPLAANTPADRRNIALNEDEISLLTSGWEQVQRFDADELAMVLLRGPRQGQAEVAEKERPTAHAVTGACAVVTDGSGRVLLGRSTSTMWELPGGRTDSSEPFEQTAVRELAEEAGLIADPADAHLLTMLWDDNHGVSRLTAVVRLNAFSGTLTCREAAKFSRWEWHPLHTLAHLDRIFAPSASALDAVWPGIIPGLPPVRAYPHAINHPRVDGEPAEAVRLRQEMTAAVISGGWAPSKEAREALRTVQRHRFTPESPLTTAYDDNLAVITRRDEDGQATSSVSAAWLQADMIESLHLEEGMTVCEVGSGGYNAELLAHVVGPAGQVVSVDIDPYVVKRTRRFTAEAGSGRVTALLGDGGLGAPGHVPDGGFDGCIITHNCWDIAPAWREQLAEDRHLVLPLEIHGYTRAITFQKHGNVLHARKFTFCGFVRDLGTGYRTTPVAKLRGGELQLRFEDGEPADVSGIDDALRGTRYELPTGVTVAGNESFETLQLYLATTLPGFCRLALERAKDTGIAAVPRGADAPAVLGDGSLAYLTHVLVNDADTSEERRSEFIAHAYGPDGTLLAEELAAAVRFWNLHVRGHGYPQLAVYPAGTNVREMSEGLVLDKQHSRLVFDWDAEKL